MREWVHMRSASVTPGLTAMADGSGEVAAVPASGASNGLSNGASATPAQPNNPLSRKLHKILETRLENDKVTGGGGSQISGWELPGAGAAVLGAGKLLPGFTVGCTLTVRSCSVLLFEHRPASLPSTV